MILDAVDVDESIDLFAVIGIIAQCIEDLGETDLRQVIRNFFRAHTDAPQLDDRTNRHPSFQDYRFSVRVRNNMGVVCRPAHCASIPPSSMKRSPSYAFTDEHPFLRINEAWALGLIPSRALFLRMRSN